MSGAHDARNGRTNRQHALGRFLQIDKRGVEIGGPGYLHRKKGRGRVSKALCRRQRKRAARTVCRVLKNSAELRAVVSHSERRAQELVGTRDQFLGDVVVLHRKTNAAAPER